MELIIREARESDIFSLTDLTHQLGYPLPEKELRNNLEAVTRNKNEIIYVMADAGKVIAWIHIFHAIRLESGSFAELGGLVVDHHYRGKGIGKLLLEKAGEWCRSMSIKVLKLRSNIIRKDAHRFYLGYGFSEIKDQKVFEMKISG